MATSLTPSQKQAELTYLEGQYGLPSGILNGLYQVESSGGKNLLSPAGAEGPFQLMPTTAAQYGVTNPYDFEDSAIGAASFLSDMIKQTGSVTGGLEAYNWGIGNMNKNSTVPTSVQQYASNVESYLTNNDATNSSSNMVTSTSGNWYVTYPANEGNTNTGTSGDTNGSGTNSGTINSGLFGSIGLENMVLILVGLILVALAIWKTLNDNTITIKGL